MGYKTPTWRAVVRSEAVPENTCPISSLWLVKNTIGRSCVSIRLGHTNNIY